MMVYRTESDKKRVQDARVVDRDVKLDLSQKEAIELLNHLVSNAPEQNVILEQALMKLADALRRADNIGKIS